MNSAYVKVLTFSNKRCLFLNKFSNIFPRTFSSHDSQASGQPKRTSLYDLHVNHGAQMEPFAGYSMPIVYNDLNVVDSHIHTRNKCSLFDVSHMLQTRIHGKDRNRLMERLTVADVDKLGPDQSCLTLFTNDEGGIIDDLILTNTSESYLFVVSNAGCADKDRDLMETEAKKLQNNGHDISLDFLNDRYSLIAIQGPSAMSCLQPFVKEDLRKLFFMNSLATSINGITDCRITRCGYTGEDGFEISIPNESAISLSQLLLGNSKDVKLAGLGARDSLRLEAGLCLYGNDIDATTSPIEAGLTWTIGKGRRERKDFPGAEKIMKQLKEKPAKRRVGLKSDKKGPPARAGCDITDKDGQKIGKVTSGCPSPSLGYNIAMGYVPNELSKQGTQHMCLIRKKAFPYDITKMPFVKSNYYTPK